MNGPMFIMPINESGLGWAQSTILAQSAKSLRVINAPIAANPFHPLSFPNLTLKTPKIALQSFLKRTIERLNPKVFPHSTDN